MKKEFTIVIKSLPDLDERFGVYVIRPNGEWDKYEYKDVRGKVAANGQYTIVIAGKEYQLKNGLRIPQKEWKQDLYSDFLRNDELEVMRRDLNHLNNRELTKLIKHRWLVYKEINNQELEVGIDRAFITERLESNLVSLYTENEFWKRWFDRYFLKYKTKIKINLQIFDTEFEIHIDKDNIENYDYAARLVSNRFNAYMCAYKKRKSEHEIALMTMLDIALLKNSD
jgi:hypothetical protein